MFSRSTRCHIHH